MEKKRFFIATLLVAAAVSVAVVSCKKVTYCYTYSHVIGDD